MRAKRQATAYTRRISAAEWVMLANPRQLIVDIQVCLEGEGDIDPAALAQAVSTAAAACPGSRLVRRGRLWVDSGRPPRVRVVSAGQVDLARPQGSALLRRQVLRHGRPCCEVLLVRGSPAIVIFRAEHAAMDGTGMLLFQQQVFRALRGEAVQSVTSRLNLDEVQQEIATRLGVDLPPATYPQLEWRSLLGPLPRKPYGGGWRRRVIDGTHPAVTAKIVRLISGYEHGHGLVSVAVDLRPFLPGLVTTAVAATVLVFQIGADQDWRDVHADLLTAISEHRFLAYRGDPKALKVPLWLYRSHINGLLNRVKRNENLVAERKLFSINASVSHLGAIDLASLSTSGFAATSYYSLGAVTLVPEINVTEYDGRTEVTLGWLDGPGLAARAEALLDWIEEGLSPRAYRDWDGNRTEHGYPDATLAGLFAAQVARTPDAVAIAGPAGDLTYAELAARAAAVTAALTARGIGREDLVAVLAGRTPAAIAAIWGVLGAGAAYLPVDAGHPDARITALLSDSGAVACLAEPGAAGRDVVPPGCQLIALDEGPAPGPGQPWPVPGAMPADLACVIYTSGSTGTPKGVQIEQAALVNYARWAAREAGIDQSARMPLVASLSFDMAGCAVFLPLLNGGSVLPVPEVNAVTLRQVIEDRGATVLAITPSHLDLINRSGIGQAAVRVIMTAGELLRRETALRAMEVFGPDCQILCQWGPTETTIVNTSHRFDPDLDTDPGVPFGRPMDNNTVYLLDNLGRHVPPGEPGEACVGGVQVARGYLGRPDLTRQRFTGLADGTRVYRTGDIARLLPRGELEFLYRADDQVKIAGHRIEPAEVAQALEAHPDVTLAAVIPRTRPGRHDKELCAYLVTSTGSTPADINAHLAARLPRYMIPAVILAVPDIPVTSNGKTDPRQLPDPFTARQSSPPAPCPGGGADDITAAVTAIWAGILQADPAELAEHNDFHQLGGNSILLLTMIEEVIGAVPAARDHVMANLAQIIREPTLGQVCDVARQAGLPLHQETPSS